jgi:hypothetical protein
LTHGRPRYDVFRPTYPFFVKNLKIGEKITYHIPVASWGLLEILGGNLTYQNTFLNI